MIPNSQWLHILNFYLIENVVWKVFNLNNSLSCFCSRIHYFRETTIENKTIFKTRISHYFLFIRRVKSDMKFRKWGVTWNYLYHVKSMPRKLKTSFHQNITPLFFIINKLYAICICHFFVCLMFIILFKYLYTCTVQGLINDEWLLTW